MDTYYIIDYTVSKQDIVIKEYDAPKKYRSNYTKGVPLGDHGPVKLYYEHKTKRKTDFPIGIQGFPIVSDRLKKILEEAEPKHIEFHPAYLICKKTGETDKSYWLLNILDNVPCLDRKRSEYRTFGNTEDIIYVFKLVIKPSALAGRNIARMAEFPYPILVSSKLRELIESARLKGIGFINIEEYRT